MKQLLHALFGERSLTKIAALFSDRQMAETAARHLVQDAGMAPAQVRVLPPDAGKPVRAEALAVQVEPEQAGIWHTIIRAHVTMGLVGAFVGSLVFLVLWALDNPAVRSAPGFSFGTFTGLGATFGLIAGGLLALRPDHGRVIALVRRGLQGGQWAVVAHPFNAGQTHRALEHLKHGSERVVRSL